MRHVALLAYIDDPFDPIGEGRIGGGQVFLFDLCRYLVRIGDRVTFVSRRNGPKPECDALSPRFTIHRLPVGPPADISTDAFAFLLDELERSTDAVLARSAPVDVIHSYHWTAGEIGRRIAARAAVRQVHSVLSIGRPKLTAPSVYATETEAIRDRCEEALFQSGAELLVACPAERDEILALYPEAAHATFRIIPHGVDPHVFHPVTETADDFVRRATGRFKQGIGNVP